MDRFSRVSLLVGLVLSLLSLGHLADTRVNTTDQPATATPLPGSGLVNGPMIGEAQQLSGSGASFPGILYTYWTAMYHKLTGVQINYDFAGSGQGIININDKKVDFGASDHFLNANDPGYVNVQSGELLSIPMTLGAVVIVYDLPSFKNTLKLTPETVAGIYLGTIKTWNDPLLVVDNPALANIAIPIIPIHDSYSLTARVFLAYLTEISNDWAKTGADYNFVLDKWPGASFSEGGSCGVGCNVLSRVGAVGFTTSVYVAGARLPNGEVLSDATLKNAAGNFVVPNAQSMAAAVDPLHIPTDLNLVVLNTIRPQAYPITVATWQFVYKTQTDPAKAVALTRFLWWELHDGQQYAAALGYAPLPLAVIKAAEQKILSITINDKQALPTSIATPEVSVMP